MAGDTDLEAEADRAVMGDCVGQGGQGSEERAGEASGNTVFSGSSSSCGESWLLAPNKLPDSGLRGLSAAPSPDVPLRRPTVCGHCAAGGPARLPWGGYCASLCR